MDSSKWQPGYLPKIGKLERCLLGSDEIQVPESFLEQKQIFNSVMSQETWNKVLTESQRQHLMTFLPKFPERENEERRDTLRKLFNGENFKFGNPLQKFHYQLKDGSFSPDIAKYSSMILRMKQQEYRNKQRRYYHNLLKEILLSRQRVFDQLSELPPDEPIKFEYDPPKKQKDSPLKQRVQRKYKRYLDEVRKECGAEELSSEEDDGSPVDRSRQQLFKSLNPVPSPEPVTPSVHATYAAKLEYVNGDIDTPPAVLKRPRPISPLEITEDTYREMLIKHRRRQLYDDYDEEEHPEYNTQNITLQDVMARCQASRKGGNEPDDDDLDFLVTPSSKGKVKKEKTEKRVRKKTAQKIRDMDFTAAATAGDDADDDEDDESRTNVSIDITEDDTSTVDQFPLMSNKTKDELSQCPSFFSLLKNIIVNSADNRLSSVKLEEKVREWQESAFSDECPWVAAQDDWVELVQPALKFLAGETIGMNVDQFIPYLDYKERAQQWHWIGVGRDSDENLLRWCNHWLKHKGEVSELIIDASQGSPPPARIRTGYVVKPSSEQEKADFQRQEKLRFAEPHKAYTYEMHGYRSVVGPVKGVFSKKSDTNRAREHALLISSRPAFITILTLVRDAVARLPNGEGNRADICELLKDSQFLAPGITDAQINVVVSGALDRLHSEKDPCVKYDVNSKVWIYLHRNRTEQEFEKIHQAQAAAQKAKKSLAKQKTTKASTPKLRDLTASQTVTTGPLPLSLGSSTESINIEDVSPGQLGSQAQILASTSAPTVKVATRQGGLVGDVSQPEENILIDQTPNTPSGCLGVTPSNPEDSPIFDMNRAREESPIFSTRRDINSSGEPLSFPESWGSPQASQSVPVIPVKEIQQPGSTERKEKVAWPKTNDSRWPEFDDDLDLILQSALLGPVNRKLQALPSITYALGKERFGLEKSNKEKKPTQAPNRRICEVKKLRAELKSLRKRYKHSNETEREGLVQLREQLRSRLRTLTSAERLRQKRRTRSKKRADFISNPYKFARNLLSEEKSGKLESSKEEVEDYLQEIHSDPLQNQPLGECDRVLPEDEPAFPLDMKEPTWKEVFDIVRKARSCSAPGPSGITYKVYKKCPKLLRRLWSLLRTVWRKGTIPECWRQAEGCFIPKEKNSKTIKEFRTVSLLSVEGKIFFSVLSRRLTSYMVCNKYINTSVQKGGIPGQSGCIEHTSALTQLLHETRINHGDLTVVWLDLANAYGSIPHQLIKTALHHYHIPDHASKIIMSYFSSIQLRFSSSQFTTKWLQLEKGIVTGCTISVILFVMGMNIIIKAAERESRGPKTNTGIRLPSNRGFMDDMTVTTETHIQARWILKALDETVTWARMQFKPKKSRRLVVRKGKVTNSFKLVIQGEEIPSLTDNPVKCLGKWFDASLTDKHCKERLQKQAEEGLRKIDKSDLPGKFKSWIFQHGLLPRLIWPLMVYDVTIITVEKVEQTISKHLRRWLGLPPSFTSLGFYSRTNKLQVPLSSLVEEFKVAKARLLLTLRDSSDEKIRGAGIEVRTGRKWSVTQAVEQVQSNLRHQDIVGATNKGREGLGTRQNQRWENSSQIERRSMVQREIRRTEEDSRSAKCVQLGPQGNWTKWNAIPERILTWQELWTYEPLQLSFLLRSVHDLLPTPANLHLWKMVDDPSCQLCDRTGTLRHILSGCPTSLTQGRYRWRHDKVLAELAHTLELERKKKRPKGRKGPVLIDFVREGTQKKVSATPTSILQESDNWELLVDLKERLKFPEEVAHTTLRPDIVLWSRKPKRVILVELTVPWEERTEEAHEMKMCKYQDLANTCRDNGWKTWVFPVEVGCRGFPSRSTWQLLGALGIKGQTRKIAIRALGKSAERASSWLWLQRSKPSWQPT